MKVLLTGGGTGGHIYPALTLWNAMKQRHPGAEVLYIGTARGLEHQLVPEAGLPFTTIEAAGLRRQLSLQALKTALTTLRGYRQAKRVLRRFRPDIVVGTGGYVTLPVVYAASSLHIPCVVWEANARPGLTNVLCSRKADAVAICFADSRRWFPKAKRVVLTGNPRGSEVLGQSEQALAEVRGKYHIRRDQKLIVCFFGSRGAETVNEVMKELIGELGAHRQWQMLYVTGDVHFAKIQSDVAGKLPDNVQIFPFLHDMPQVLPQASVVVTRAGGATLAEICSLGLPSILIPSPYVTANHQEENAKRLVEAGAARMIVERDLTASSLLQALTAILDAGEAVGLSDAAKKLATPDAVDLLHRTVLEVLHTTTQ